MLCQHCNKNQANTFISHTINGQTSEFYLCSECAAALSDTGMSLLGFNFAFPKTAQQLSKACPACGATIEYISETGRLGCAECYSFFEKELTPAIERIHGRVFHTPQRMNPPKAAAKTEQKKEKTPLEKLRGELKVAIEAEEFEKAAALRDQIRDLEGEQ